jgi:hypothetical protein
MRLIGCPPTVLDRLTRCQAERTSTGTRQPEGAGDQRCREAQGDIRSRSCRARCRTPSTIACVVAGWSLKTSMLSYRCPVTLLIARRTGASSPSRRLPTGTVAASVWRKRGRNRIRSSCSRVWGRATMSLGRAVGVPCARGNPSARRRGQRHRQGRPSGRRSRRRRCRSQSCRPADEGRPGG